MRAFHETYPTDQTPSSGFAWFLRCERRPGLRRPRREPASAQIGSDPPRTPETSPAAAPPKSTLACQRNFFHRGIGCETRLPSIILRRPSRGCRRTHSRDSPSRRPVVVSGTAGSPDDRIGDADMTGGEQKMVALGCALTPAPENPPGRRAYWPRRDPGQPGDRQDQGVEGAKALDVCGRADFNRRSRSPIAPTSSRPDRVRRLARAPGTDDPLPRR